MTAIAIQAGGKSCERARFSVERDLFVRIVALSLVFARPFNMLQRMNQVAVRNHGVVSGLLKLPAAMIFRRGALMFGGVFQQFGSLQMMINAFLRHDFRIANGAQSAPTSIKN
jgi:hypothetical protein